MIDLLLWYIVIFVLGGATFPLVYRLFPGLADRGYAFSKIFGLLVWGYIFWLLTSLGWTYNDRGGILFAGLLLVALSVLFLKGHASELVHWLRKNWKAVLGIEIVFLIAFGLILFIRAGNPEILATEKPMELAFINAIRRSPAFPPNDPWLSGYAISYYYFGYIFVVMFANLVGTTSGVAFNLGISLIFALSAVGAYGLVLNLLTSLRSDHHISLRIIWQSTLGPVFVLLVSNLVGLLEVLHARGVFWRNDATGSWSSSFWSWLGIKDLVLPPQEPLGWLPTRYLWWWRSSRVVQDFDLAGNPIEIIDEFPFFSYLLADLHPHVLAMPFAFLAMGLAFQILINNNQYKTRIIGIDLFIHPAFIFVGMLVFGGLAFLNTWDFPIYTVLFAGAYSLNQVFRSGWSWRRLSEFLILGILLGLGGIFLYLPFFLGFQSQAGGLLPNLINPTRGTHLWVMFATLLLPIFAYFWLQFRCNYSKDNLRFGVLTTIGIIFGLFIFATLFGLAITLWPVLGDLYTNLLAAGTRAEILTAALSRRFLQPGGWITLGLLLVLCLALLKSAVSQNPPPEMVSTNSLGYDTGRTSHIFVVGLILLGTLLILAPEFFFLRDLFNNRMNTIFKFYYQAWLLWGVAAAFGSIVILNQKRGLAGWGVRLGFALILIVGLIYPVLSLNTKMNGFKPVGGWTLDGTAHLIRQVPDEWDAIRFLQEAPYGTVAEAIGGSYSTYARISTHSGLPTVLGWPFHEIQWRGSATEQGTREADILRLYCTSDWDEAQAILDQYNIRYIILGPLEYSKYQPEQINCPGGVNESKFDRNLHRVFENGNVRIYQVP
jgi:YYY domain-containing protein